jgi:hypothetical protein
MLVRPLLCLDASVPWHLQAVIYGHILTIPQYVTNMPHEMSRIAHVFDDYFSTAKYST